MLPWGNGWILAAVHHGFRTRFKLARADRDFLASAVRHLVTDLGIRQFLDIGTGLPAAENTHEVAQRAAPESRVVYVDNDRLTARAANTIVRWASIESRLRW